MRKTFFQVPPSKNRRAKPAGGSGVFAVSQTALRQARARSIFEVKRQEKRQPVKVAVRSSKKPPVSAGGTAAETGTADQALRRPYSRHRLDSEEIRHMAGKEKPARPPAKTGRILPPDVKCVCFFGR
jgi:hypothetical protein